MQPEQFISIITKKELTTLDLQTVIHRQIWRDKVKVVPYNCKPDFVPSYPQAYICNTHNSNEEGQHWFVVFHPVFNGLTEVFDSFGRELVKNTLFNPYSLQHPLSSVCGYYCLLYLHSRFVLKKSLSDFLNWFDTKTPSLNNDIKALKLCQQYGLTV